MGRRTFGDDVIGDAERELSNINKLTDGRPESFFKLLEERAKELAPEYPYTKNDAFEWLCAITSSLEGTELARQDWEKEVVKLKEDMLQAANRIDQQRDILKRHEEKMEQLEAENNRLKYRLNHQTEDDVEACRQGKHTDCGAEK